ncbi:substrate-binding domain-containing protein [Labrys wisconsinensis]|uniref:ABC-type sugar transport system substrate-binding protein n=1 Tax=Labrys wisconsinensis TaxID=425677 RepID=A0ABU0JIL3_9HYPH|nr:substrate-binding domain-containing protein [Labrys wisconsinensis]MDQ0474130.1 ABC-type sugar transport system substrate-binding protein [Labrys wisconsinensis]
MIKHVMWMAALAAGLAAAPAQAQDKPLFGAILKTPANPHWNAMAAGIRDAAGKLGVDVVVSTVESESAAEQQLNNCESMLLRNPKALLVGAINSNILLPCLKKASDQGIAIVDLDYNLDRSIAEGAGVKVTFTAGNDGAVTGGVAADFIARQLGADAAGPVLVLEGLPGNPVGAARGKGFRDEIAKVAPKLTQTTLNGDWDRTKSANIVNDMLQRNPDLKAVFAANDTMAVGAEEALQAAGKGDVITVGVDGSADAIDSIKAGRLTATVGQFPYLVGYRSVELLAEHLQGGKALDGYQSTGQSVLTRQALEQKTDAMIQYLR